MVRSKTGLGSGETNVLGSDVSTIRSSRGNPAAYRGRHVGSRTASHTGDTIHGTGHGRTGGQYLVLMQSREMVMKNRSIRIVINKDGSQTVYVPVELTDLFDQIVRAGDTDLFESEPAKYDEVPNPLFTWEFR